jgi:hypothetical protein
MPAPSHLNFCIIAPRLRARIFSSVICFDATGDCSLIAFSSGALITLSLHMPQNDPAYPYLPSPIVCHR